MRCQTRPARLEPADYADSRSSAAIVAGALLMLAAILGLIGRNRVNHATPPIPEAEIESAKTDIDVVEERARR
ncbi:MULTISPECIES: phage holin family protein [Nonomuraea]|uniref:Phage holin family protein n=2 Tax=Nonomuraea TaxID=83681 RepID=A0ABW4T035_9ACTN